VSEDVPAYSADRGDFRLPRAEGESSGAAGAAAQPAPRSPEAAGLKVPAAEPSAQQPATAPYGGSPHEISFSAAERIEPLHTFTRKLSAAIRFNGAEYRSLTIHEPTVEDDLRCSQHPVIRNAGGMLVGPTYQAVWLSILCRVPLDVIAKLRKSDEQALVRWTAGFVLDESGM